MVIFVLFVTCLSAVCVATGLGTFVMRLFIWFETSYLYDCVIIVIEYRRIPICLMLLMGY